MEGKKRRRIIFLICFLVGLVAFVWKLSIGNTNSKGINNTALPNHEKTVLPQNALTALTLVVKEEEGQLKYGFRNAQGVLQIPIIYDEAFPFDAYGMARVKIGTALFLIDSLNTQYPLAERIEAIESTTLAISLSAQELEDLPQVVLEHPQLKILYLRDNNLKDLPEDLQNLEDLRIVDLGYNQFSKVPQVLSRLQKLSQLDLSNNKIVEVDENLAALEDLDYLDLSNNKLESVPEALVQRTTLSLNIGGNSMKRQGKNTSFKNPKEFYQASTNKTSKPTTLAPQSPPSQKTTSKDQPISTRTKKTSPTTKLKERTPIKIKGGPNMTYLGNLDCENCFSIDLAHGKHHHLMSKELILVSKTDFDYRIQFENTEEGIVGIIYTTAVASNLIRPMRFNDKIMFISASGLKVPFSFVEETQRVTKNGRTAFVNRFKVSRKEIIWLLNNPIHQFRLVDMVAAKMYPFSMDHTRSQAFRRAAGCLYKKLEDF